LTTNKQNSTLFQLHSTDSDEDEEEEDEDEVEDRFSGDAQEEQQFDSGSEHSRETFFDPSLSGISTAHARSKSSGRKSKEVSIKKRRKRSKTVPYDEDREPKRRPLSESFHTNRKHQRLKNHPNPNMSATAKSRAAETKRKRDEANPDDDSDESTVAPETDQAKKIRKLKLENFRLKKRALYGTFETKKVTKGQKLTAMQREVQKRTRTDLFPVKKFFQHENRLLLGTKFIMDSINPKELKELDGEERVDAEEMWMAEHKDLVRTSLNGVRNYVIQELREFMMKIFAESKEDLYPNVEQILQLMERKGLLKGPNKKAMEAFLDIYWNELVPKVAGHTNWPPSKRHYENLSTATNPPRIKGAPAHPCVHHSSEALLVAIWENFYPKWRYQGIQKRNNEPIVDTHKDMKGLAYTNPKTGRNKFGGWTEVGKDRVKELAKLAKEAREETHVEKVESAALVRIRYVRLVAHW
jgi:hypothetical protein